jgi:hypothetical protein
VTGSVFTEADPAVLVFAFGAGHVVAAIYFLRTERAFWATDHTVGRDVFRELLVLDQSASLAGMADLSTLETHALATFAGGCVGPATASAFFLSYVLDAAFTRAPF